MDIFEIYIVDCYLFEVVTVRVALIHLTEHLKLKYQTKRFRVSINLSTLQNLPQNLPR